MKTQTENHVMARFRIFLVGSSQPLDIDLLANDAAELKELASRSRFLDGHMAEANQDGVCPGVLIPTCRLQMIIET
jgi:hypothetical protein